MRHRSLHTILGAIVATTMAGCGGSVGDNPTDGSGGSTGGAGGSGGNGGNTTGTGGSGGGNVGSGGSGGSTTAAGGSGGSTVGSGGTGGGQPAEMLCIGDEPQYTDGLSLPTDVDYLGLYHQSQFNDPSLAIVEETGVPCQRATDPDACTTTLDGLMPTTGFVSGGQIPEWYYLLYTRGDEVGAVTNLDELKELIGRVDTPNEAALVFWASHRRVGCGDVFRDGSGFYAEGTWTISDCPYTTQAMRARVSGSGTVDSTPLAPPEESGGCAGRRPTGLLAANTNAGGSGLGDYFAKLCHLEGAAVVAFAVLEAELREHGAPDALAARAIEAQHDEMRHTRSMAALARRFGGAPPPVEVKPPRRRSLFEMALENAVEGCVRETYGALAAHWQASAADDEEVRAVWRAIARDETEHAELSRAIDEWILPRLTPDERARLERARLEAVSELEREMACDPDGELVTLAGMPTAEQAKELIASLAREVWAA